MHLFNIRLSLPLALMLSVFTCFFSSSPAAIIYVNPLAGGANNGSSWMDAYTDLQPALAAASDGDEIWVAQGLYIPSVEVDVDASGGGDTRERTFQIPSGVMVYGGFVGGEGSLEARDWLMNPTILSGDLDVNDVNMDGNNIAESPADIVGDNAYHVVFTQNVSANTRLDGFIITAGYAANAMPGFSPNLDGGGWLDLDGTPPNSSSPGIYNCQFQGNYAQDRGGAIHIGSFQPGTFEPTISHTHFSGNEALRAGGAMYMLGDGATVDSCTFTDNHATNISGMDTGPGSGGAVFLIASNASFNACLFLNNSATGNPTGPFEGGGGGAVYVAHSTSPTNTLGASIVSFVNSGFYNNTTGGNGGAWGGAIVHYSDGGNLTAHYTGCVFSGNTATDDGGAIAHFARTISAPDMLPPILEPSYTNCTFHDNDAGQQGGAMYIDGFEVMGTEMLSAVIENSILYGNTAGASEPEVFNNANNLVSYSLIQGSGGSGGGWDNSIGTDGGNNIDTDPLFTNAADPDGMDDIPGTPDDGLFPDATSLVIDVGNGAAGGLAGVVEDFVGGMRIQGSEVDMGAYEQAGDPCGPIPVGLNNKDIGNTGGYVGTVCYDMGTYFVDASGSDIWGKKDGFHFVYRRMAGDGEIIARVDDIGFNHFWDLAGVMMRVDLSPESKNVLMGVNAGGKAFFQRRKFTGGFTAFHFAGNGATPKWVRIIRFGDFLAGFKSSDGIAWQWVGLFKVPMPHIIFVGLATSTPLAGTPNNYELSHFSVQGITYKKAPFDVTQVNVLEEKDGPRVEKIATLSPQFHLYPNPATSASVIEWVSEEEGLHTLNLFDTQGRFIRKIFSGNVEKGKRYQIKLDRNGLSNGLYVVRMRGQTHQQTLIWMLKE